MPETFNQTVLDFLDKLYRTKESSWTYNLT
jgi:hypothetical protein